MTLTGTDELLIVNALRVASEQYRKDAEIARAANHERMARQFETQADDCDALLDRMEN